MKARGQPASENGARVGYRAARVLEAIARHPGASNRRIGAIAGAADEGQVSRLLARLEQRGLVRRDNRRVLGLPNAWRLTAAGARLERAIAKDPGLVMPLPARRPLASGVSGQPVTAQAEPLRRGTARPRR